MRARAGVLGVVIGFGLACGGGSDAGLQGTLKELQSGDIACYVLFDDASGAEQSLDGDFELCPGGGADASGLIGKKVALTTTRANVQAGSCEGDPECPDTDEVDLVVGIAAAD